MAQEANPYESPQVDNATEMMQKVELPADAIPLAPDSVAFGTDIRWFFWIWLLAGVGVSFISRRAMGCFLYGTLIQLVVLLIIGIRVLGFFKSKTRTDTLLIRFGAILFTLLIFLALSL
jgi:hypothetical protein